MEGFIKLAADSSVQDSSYLPKISITNKSPTIHRQFANTAFTSLPRRHFSGNVSTIFNKQIFVAKAGHKDTPRYTGLTAIEYER